MSEAHGLSFLLKRAYGQPQMYIQPLCSVNPPIIPPEQLGTFIQNVFCNIGDLHTHHKQLLDQFFEIQRNEHPIIRSVTTVMHNAILKLKEVYLEYAVRYPTAEYLISDEMEINQKLEAFVEVSLPAHC